MTLENLVDYASRDGRVCPQPQPWNRLWELLPDRQRRGVSWEPPPPLILAAWGETTDADKRHRFHYHLQWAAAHGALHTVHDFLTSLDPGDWHISQ